MAPLCVNCHSLVTEGLFTEWLNPIDIREHTACIKTFAYDTSCPCRERASKSIEIWWNELDVSKDKACNSYGESLSLSNVCDLCFLVRHSLKHQADKVAELRALRSQGEDYTFRLVMNTRTEVDIRACPTTRLLVWRADLPSPKLRHLSLECVLKVVIDQSLSPAAPQYQQKLGLQSSKFNYKRDCFSQAIKWLRACESHIRCGREGRPSTRPARLIDVGNDEVAPSVCDITDQQAWIALSYCWGLSSDFVLTQRTIKDFQSGVPLARFPPTIHDAIVIARKLNIRFLWVDALCILQDSEEDWLRESVKMHDIYKGATLTLIVANAASVNDGILPERFDKSCDLQSCRLPLELAGGYGARLQLRTEKAWPIRSRAWCYQENALASRTLTYSTRGMAWRCRDVEHRCGGITNEEGSNDSDPYAVSLDSYVPGKSFITGEKRVSKISRKLKYIKIIHSDMAWMANVQAYSRRRLTKDKDLLPALGALAAKFARSSGSEYVAGLFFQHSLEQLTWIIDPARTFVQEKIEYLDAYRAPSFSWASVQSNGVRFECDCGSAELTSIAQIVKWEVEPLSPGEPYGQIKGGFLALKARLYPLDSLPAVSDLWVSVLERCPGARQEYDQRLRTDPSMRTLSLFELFTWSGETESSRWPYHDEDESLLTGNVPTGTPNRYRACLVLASCPEPTRPKGRPRFVRVGFLRLDQGQHSKVLRGMAGPSQHLIERSLAAFDEVEKMRKKVEKVEVEII